MSTGISPGASAPPNAEQFAPVIWIIETKTFGEA